MPVFIRHASLISHVGMGIPVHLERLGSGLRPLTEEASVSDTAGILANEQLGWDRATCLGLAVSAGLRGQLRHDNTAVVMGSSRGATGLIEGAVRRFLSGERLAVTTSPRTTSGSFASSIASDLRLNGPAFFLSSACSTGLQAVLAASGLIASGLCEEAVCGATEAPLTPFTRAQLKELRVIKRQHGPYEPFSDARDGMVLAEGAASFLLTKEPGSYPKILGMGSATEQTTLTGITGEGLFNAMERAFISSGCDPRQIDLIVAHGAGTRKGDQAEMDAYEAMWGASEQPPITSFKWALGHMLGASGAVSLALAVGMLEENRWLPIPYQAAPPWSPIFVRQPDSIDTILVTALGFGGNSVAMVIGK